MSEETLLIQALSKIDNSLAKVSDKVDGLLVDVATLKERSLSLDLINQRLEELEEIQVDLKEKQNIIYAVAGVIATFVSGIMLSIKSIATMIFGNGT